jgi:hypothetical protein
VGVDSQVFATRQVCVQRRARLSEQRGPAQLEPPTMLDGVLHIRVPGINAKGWVSEVPVEDLIGICDVWLRRGDVWD